MSLKSTYVFTPVMIVFSLFIVVPPHSFSQEVDQGIFKKVLRMSNSELKRLYDDPMIITSIRDIKSTMKVPQNAIMHSSYHNDVDLSQVSFDVEVRYNKIVNKEIGEIASYHEILRCVLSKYRSLKWNRLSLYQNDCHDCGNVTLTELKRGINKKYIRKK